jgi:hypothetical protein
LAKACSAFANTYGGLLVVGVADDDDTLVGIEPVASEAQLWVKDTLRGLVLPMPPFRARWLPTDGSRGLILVLVEESATTPHLLTRSGAIYVRNPGSSDPVPIADQRTLFDLTARGERALADARSNATSVLDIGVLVHADPTETLVVAAAGVGGDFEARLFDASSPEALGRTVWGSPESSVEGRFPVWEQHYVGVRRGRETPVSPRYRGIEYSVIVTRDGVVAISRGYVPGGAHPLGVYEEAELRSQFAGALVAAREILSEYGGHGDLRLVYKVDDLAGRGLLLAEPNHRVIDAAEFPEPLVVEINTGFDDETAEERVFGEVIRAAGVGPTAPSRDASS